MWNAASKAWRHHEVRSRAWLLSLAEIGTYARPKPSASSPLLIFKLRKDAGRKAMKRWAPEQTLEHSAPPQGYTGEAWSCMVPMRVRTYVYPVINPWRLNRGSMHRISYFDLSWICYLSRRLHMFLLPAIPCNLRTSLPRSKMAHNGFEAIPCNNHVRGATSNWCSLDQA